MTPLKTIVIKIVELSRTLFLQHMQFPQSGHGFFQSFPLEALEGENIPSENKAKFLEGAPFVAGCGGSQAMLDVLTGASAYTNVASFGGMQTVVLSTDLLKIALETMVSYLDGTVVPQDNTQPIIWANAENAGQFTGYAFAEAQPAELPAEEPTAEATTAGE